MARWRLATHLRRQDWSAVIIDLLIVVVGVFLRIQASSWNDARKDKRENQKTAAGLIATIEKEKL